MVIVVMGAAGAGKTTVGRALADALGWAFWDADNLHTEDSVAKMRAGTPLTDEDRLPWLERVREVIAGALEQQRDAVIACSALRASYRRMLTDVPGQVRFVHLEAPAELLRDRVSARSGHFAPVELVASQLATLEPPAEALTLDAAEPIHVLVKKIRGTLTI